MTLSMDLLLPLWWHLSLIQWLKSWYIGALRSLVLSILRLKLSICWVLLFALYRYSNLSIHSPTHLLIRVLGLNSGLHRPSIYLTTRPHPQSPSWSGHYGTMDRNHRLRTNNPKNLEMALHVGMALSPFSHGPSAIYIALTWLCHKTESPYYLWHHWLCGMIQAHYTAQSWATPCPAVLTRIIFCFLLTWHKL